MPRTRRRKVPTPDQLALQLTAGRIVIAAGILAAPTTFARVVGTDSATAARVAWLTRMMAVRDGAIGAGGALAARRGSGAAPWLVAGAASDAVDAAVVLQALRSGRLRGLPARLIAPGAAGAAAVGLVAATRVRRR